jgi:ACT domain-containing protein
MTADEHTLMAHMFIRQTMLIKSVVEILKSRDLLHGDDLSAFESLVRQTELSDKEIFHAVVAQYTAFATELGLQDDLPH